MLKMWTALVADPHVSRHRRHDDHDSRAGRDDPGDLQVRPAHGRCGTGLCRHVDGTRLTEEQKRGLLFISDFYRAHPLPA
ncbi:MAG: hypothetical protein JSR47_17715 [Proteobacteria bacterium]|nr:hypothetical protein [Pseudomonadota bacterium]MBS0550254.1 hypothetical protein [Pseudomonadota bacterium]